MTGDIIERMRTALSDLLPYVVNDDSPGGCDGYQPDCPQCAAIANTRAVLAEAEALGTIQHLILNSEAIHEATMTFKPGNYLITFEPIPILDQPKEPTNEAQ